MYCREVETEHGQIRWEIDVVIRGVKRQLLFAHELAAHEALMIAGVDREECVAPEETLRKLRMLAWNTLYGSHELTEDEWERLQEIDAARHDRRAAE